MGIAKFSTGWHYAPVGHPPFVQYTKHPDPNMARFEKRLSVTVSKLVNNADFPGGVVMGDIETTNPSIVRMLLQAGGAIMCTQIQPMIDDGTIPFEYAEMHCGHLDPQKPGQAVIPQKVEEIPEPEPDLHLMSADEIRKHALEEHNIYLSGRTRNRDKLIEQFKKKLEQKKKAG